MTNSPPIFEVKCPVCGWVHASVPLSSVVSDAQSQDELARFFRCFQCGCPSKKFIPAQPDDAQVGSTLQPVVIGDAPR